MTVRTDLSIVQLPPSYPNVGGLLGKNTLVTDPDFGTPIMRITDGSSGSGNHSSMQTADNPSGYSVVNTNDTMIQLRNTSGAIFLHQFDPQTMKATQLGTTAPFKLTGAGCFSKKQPGKFFNCTSGSTVINALSYKKSSTGWAYIGSTELCDFASILPAGFKVTWQSELSITEDKVFAMAFSSTGNQNSGYHLCLYNSKLQTYRMLDSQALHITEIGSKHWGAVGVINLTNVPFTNFFMHGVNQTPNPAYILISAPGLVGAMVWDITSLNITGAKASGHHGLGFLSEFCGGPGGGQYGASSYTSPTTQTMVIPTNMLPANQTPPQSYTGDQHSAFCPVTIDDTSILFITNGQPSVFPFTSCWMGELRGIDVSGKVSGTKGTVYRICHTFNSGKENEYIGQNAMIAPSQTGHFIFFTSDWAGANTVAPLGSTVGDPTGIVGTNGRADVFCVRNPFVS